MSSRQTIFRFLCLFVIVSNKATARKTMIEVAKYKNAKQSGELYNASPSKAVDDNKRTLFLQDGCTHSEPSHYPFWAVDLGSTGPYDIVGAMVTNRADGFGYRLHDYTASVSMLSQDLYGQVCYFREGTVDEGAAEFFSCYKVLRGRQFIIRIQSNQEDEILSLCDVEVYSEINNVAVGRKAWQSSTYWNGNAMYAVDGVTRNIFDRTNFCTHTEYQTKTKPWWKVDLGDMHEIYGVVIINRKELGKRLHNFHITVSNTTEPDAVGGVLCKRRQGVVGDGQTEYLKCKQVIHGRIVAVHKHSYGVLTLCELMVHGKPIVGKDCAIDQDSLSLFWTAQSVDGSNVKVFPEGVSRVPVGSTIKIRCFKGFAWRSSGGAYTKTKVCREPGEFLNEPRCEGCLMSLLGTEYKGMQSFNNVSVCQEWRMQSPHEHPYSLALGGEDNFCRNPDMSTSGPWCYTMVSVPVKAPCPEIPICRGIVLPNFNCKKDKKGTGYVGLVDRARDQSLCHKWNDLDHDRTYPDSFESYCRNPSGSEEGPYCYDDARQKKICNVIQCEDLESAYYPLMKDLKDYDVIVHGLFNVTRYDFN